MSQAVCHRSIILCRVSLGTVAVSPSMLGSNASIAFDTDPLWWFYSVTIAHYTPYRAGPTKCRTYPWHREYTVWSSTWRYVRAFPMIFCAWDYRSGPIFLFRSQCDVKTPSDFVFEAVVHKQRNAVQHLSASTPTESNVLASESFPWLWGVPKWLEALPMTQSILLAFGTHFQQVMPQIRYLRKFSLFYHHAGPRHQSHRAWIVETTHDTFFH